MRQCKNDGMVLVLSALSMLALLGFAVLGVDLGYMAMSRSGLQNAADSAALAGASGLTGGGQAKARQRAVEYAAKHQVGGSPVVLDPAHVTFRHFNVKTHQFTPGPENSVTVTLQASPATFFGKVFGQATMPLDAAATAVNNQRGFVQFVVDTRETRPVCPDKKPASNCGYSFLCEGVWNSCTCPPKAATVTPPGTNARDLQDQALKVVPLVHVLSGEARADVTFFTPGSYPRDEDPPRDQDGLRSVLMIGRSIDRFLPAFTGGGKGGKTGVTDLGPALVEAAEAMEAASPGSRPAMLVFFNCEQGGETSGLHAAAERLNELNASASMFVLGDCAGKKGIDVRQLQAFVEATGGRFVSPPPVGTNQLQQLIQAILGTPPFLVE